MTTVYVPGTEEQDPKKIIMSLHQIGPRLGTAEDDILDRAIGPASSTDNAAARFDGTGGKTLQDSALLIADTTGALSRSGDGGIPVQGTNTNDSASAGYVGQYAEVLQNNVAITTATATNISSISLTAGDWDLDYAAYFVPAATTTVTYINANLNTVSATQNSALGTYSQIFYNGEVPNMPLAAVVPTNRVLIASTTTYYANAITVFGVSTMAVYTIMRARRVR